METSTVEARPVAAIAQLTV